MTQRTKTQWQALIAQQRSSGKSIKIFCQEQNLSYGYFNSVKSKLNQTKASAPGFVKVKPVHTNASALTIRHHDVQISIPASISPSWVAELVKGLNP